MNINEVAQALIGALKQEVVANQWRIEGVILLHNELIEASRSEQQQKQEETNGQPGDESDRPSQEETAASI